MFLPHQLGSRYPININKDAHAWYIDASYTKKFLLDYYLRIPCLITPMATPSTTELIDDFDLVHQLPEPVHVHSYPAHAPLSPPPTVKKSASNISNNSSPDQHSRRKTWRCIPNPLVSSQGLRRPQARYCFVLFVLVALGCWWRSRIQQDFEIIKQKKNLLTKNLQLSPVLDGLQFLPANNQHIHVSAGRPF